MLLLEGPSGIGESTTLLWLFHKLKKQGKSVCALSLKIEYINQTIIFVKSEHSQNRKVILLFDFNSITANTDINVLWELYYLIHEVKKYGVVVVAASSILCIIYQFHPM